MLESKNALTRSLLRVTYVWHSGLENPAWYYWLFIYVYKLITNYLFNYCWLSIYVLYICVQVN